MNITIICSDIQHKIFPYLEKWVTKNVKSHNILLVTKSDQITKGDILFIISCTEIIKKNIRKKFKQTLVIHESDLPKGRGWSPLVWQIINGEETIPISLFDAEDKVDSGDIWKKEFVKAKNHEVSNEINSKVFKTKIKLMDFAVKSMNTIKKTPQIGKPTFYLQRKPEDSELDVNKTINEQFNLMRIADNERYPCFINFRGHKYKVTLSKIS
jgi:methionyl-tRNA formyltransferase